MVTSLWMLLMDRSAAVEDQDKVDREADERDGGGEGSAVAPAEVDGRGTGPMEGEDSAERAPFHASPGSPTVPPPVSSSFFADGRSPSRRLAAPAACSTSIYFSPSPIPPPEAEGPSEFASRGSQGLSAGGNSPEPLDVVSSWSVERGPRDAEEPLCAPSRVRDELPTGGSVASSPNLVPLATASPDLAPSTDGFSGASSPDFAPPSDGSSVPAPSAASPSAAASASVPCAPAQPPRPGWSVRGAIGGALRATATGVVVAALDYAIAYRRRQLETSGSDEASEASVGAATGAEGAIRPRLSPTRALSEGGIEGSPALPPAPEASSVTHRRSPFHGRVSIADWKERLLAAIDDAERTALSYGLPLASSPSRSSRLEPPAGATASVSGPPAASANLAASASASEETSCGASGASPGPEEGRHMDQLMVSLLEELGRAAGIETDAAASSFARGRSSAPSRCSTPSTPRGAWTRAASPRPLSPDGPSPRDASPAPSSVASTPPLSPSAIPRVSASSTTPPPSPLAAPRAAASRLAPFGVPLLPLQRSTYVSTYTSLTSIPRRLRRHVARWPAERGDERGLGAGRDARGARAASESTSEGALGASGGGSRPHKEGYEERPADAAVREAAEPSGSPPSTSSAVSPAPSSREASPRSSTTLCSICMDRRPAVEVDSCRHELCFVCARRLCLSADAAVPSCPFCRGHIQGFFPRRQSSEGHVIQTREEPNADTLVA